MYADLYQGSMSALEKMILSQLGKIETRHKHELDAIYERHKLERAEFDAALNAVRSVSTGVVVSSRPKAKMKINDAIVEAVNSGRKNPRGIFDFIENQLGIDTTINSVRVRVSKLRIGGLIAKDAEGYAPIQKDKAPDEPTSEALKVAGEVEASPIERVGFSDNLRDLL